MRNLVLAVMACLRGVTTLGVLVAFIQYSQRFFRPSSGLSEKYNILQSSHGSGRDGVFKLLDSPVEITSPAVTKIPNGPGRIEFRPVWFAYRSVESANDHVETGLARPRLRSGFQLTGACPVSTQSASPEPDWICVMYLLSSNQGETVAIVGHTGAGKTTIISLLMRFYDVQKGAIKIGWRRYPRTIGHSRPAPPLRSRAARSVLIYRHG